MCSIHAISTIGLMQIDLAFGATGIKACLPAGFRYRVLEARSAQPLADWRTALESALDQPIGGFRVQELDAASACRTIAVPPPGAPIEQHQWEVVGSGHRGETCRSGLTEALAT